MNLPSSTLRGGFDPLTKLLLGQNDFGGTDSTYIIGLMEFYNKNDKGLFPLLSGTPQGVTDRIFRNAPATVEPSVINSRKDLEKVKLLLNKDFKKNPYVLALREMKKNKKKGKKSNRNNIEDASLKI